MEPNGTSSVSTVAAAPDRDKHAEAAGNHGEIGEDERRFDRQAVAPKVRILAVTEEQQTLNDAHGSTIGCIGECGPQVGRMTIDAEQVPADTAVRGGDDEACRMNVLLELRLVAIRKTDDIGDTWVHRLGASEEMPAGSASRVVIRREVFDLGRLDVGRLVTRIDADRYDPKVAAGVERDRVESSDEVLQGQPAQRLAPQVIEDQHHRLACKEL